MNKLLFSGAATLLLLSTTAAMGQSSAEKFERSLQQIHQDTLVRVNPDIPADERATFEYGGYLSFGYLSLDDNANQNHGLRQSEVVGYARANFDGAHEFFIRYRTGYRDFNHGDSFTGRGSEPIDGDLDAAYYRFDLQRSEAAYHGKTISNNLVIKAGRDLVYWGNGLTLSEVIDGGMVDVTMGQLTLSMIGGVTPTRTVDFDSSRPKFDFNTNRGFYGGLLTTTVGDHHPYIYALIQRDYNVPEQLLSDDAGNIVTKFDYNSWYIGIGSGGSLSDKLLYGVEAVYEGGRSLSNSFTILNGATLPSQVEQVHDNIQAWAADGRLDYLFADPHRTRISAELTLASGDNDRVNTSNTFNGNQPGTKDTAFNGFGLLNTGLAFAPSVSNLLMLRVGGSTFPLDFSPSARRMQFGTDVFIYNKFDTTSAIDEISRDHRFLGWEPDAYFNWQITSDVTFSTRYGVFFPNGDTLTSSKARQFLYMNVTYSF